MSNTQRKIFTIPNILSFFRLALIPVFVWLYCVKEKYLWTGLILIISGITDLADGFIARRFHMVSDLGKVLDPVADKLTQGAMLFCLCTRFPFIIALIVLMALKEVFMLITGYFVIKKTGNVFSAKWHGKIATALLDASLVLHVFWYEIPQSVSNLMIGACIMMVAVSFLLYGRDNIKVLTNRGNGDACCSR